MSKTTTCPKCKGSGEQPDMSPYTMSYELEKCDDCNGTGQVEPKEAKRKQDSSFSGAVMDARGGVVEILVDRDTATYPSPGQRVIVKAERKQEFSIPTTGIFEETLTINGEVVSRKLVERPLDAQANQTEVELEKIIPLPDRPWSRLDTIAAIKALIKQENHKAVNATLNRLERNGHGGGNWRRLIELERSKLNGEPERE